MKENILKHLKDVEQEFDVGILLAVESGSRAWGFASPDSDWDVRFIYMHRPEWYLQVVNTDRDVIQKMYDDGVDLVGFDLKKALGLMYKSNPTLYEWLRSPIVYHRHVPYMVQMDFLAAVYYQPYKMWMHYRGGAINNYHQYIERNGHTLKKFLYYLRGLLACKYINSFKAPPPVPFNKLVNDTVCDDGDVRREILNLVSIKSRSREHDKMEVSPLLVEYADNLREKFSVLTDKSAPLMYRDKKGVDAFLLNEFMFGCVMKGGIPSSVY